MWLVVTMFFIGFLYQCSAQIVVVFASFYSNHCNQPAMTINMADAVQHPSGLAPFVIVTLVSLGAIHVKVLRTFLKLTHNIHKPKGLEQ